MLNFPKIIGIVIVVLTTALVGVYGYFHFSTGGTEENQEEKETQVWWIASDPHIGLNEANPFDAIGVAIEDVNNLGIADYAIQLGDVINETMAYRENFFQLMDSLEVENWYYILGNHDFLNPPSDENLLPPIDMTLDVMGMKWILISDHMGDPRGTMPENLQGWFVDQIIFSDKPVFVFAHQPPSQWLVWNELGGLVKGSKLRAWIYGHVHRWSASWYEDQLLIFSDSSLDWANNYKGVFMYLERKGNIVNVTLRFRDHKNRMWVTTPLEGKYVENISFSVEVA
ncbi:MAG: metallophosphoesterase family protein [Thermodesulfobacteriota bacterium]